MAERPMFFAGIREDLYRLWPAVFPKPPWVSRYAPLCTCNGMTFEEAATDIRSILAQDDEVTLCDETARRIADLLTQHGEAPFELVVTGTSVSPPGTSAQYPRYWPPRTWSKRPAPSQPSPANAEEK